MGALKVKKSKKEEFSDHAGKVTCLRCGRGFDPSSEGATSEYGATCAKLMGIVTTTSSTSSPVGTLSVVPSEPRQLDFFSDVDPKNIKEMEKKAFRKEVVTELKENMNVEIGVEDEVEVDKEKQDSGTENDYYDTESDFRWARKSKYENFGEETRGAARHKRNAYRDWKDVLNNAHEATKNEDVLYPEVIKNVQRGMATVVDESNDMDSLILGLILNKFPKKLPEARDLGDYHQKAKGLVTDILALKLQSSNPLEYFSKARVMIKDLHSKEPRGYFRELCRHLHNNLDGGKTAAKREFFDLVDFVNNEKSDYYGWLKAESVAAKLTKAKGKMKDVAVQFLKGDGVKKICGKTKPRLIGGTKKTTFKQSDFYKGITPNVEKIRFKGYDDARDFLTKKMKVKGFEFGNSIPDSKRPEYARTAAQAFDDLSKITGLTPEQLTARGQLGVLIGVKGTPGSLATYWPGTKDININANSVGSIAHEMGHFFDNHLGKISSRTYLSGVKENSANLTEMDKAYLDLAPTMGKYLNRIRGTDSFRDLSSKAQQTFRSSEETFARCFESYISDKAQKQGLKNNVLVAHVDSELYPTSEEVMEMSDKMESLINLMKKTL